MKTQRIILVSTIVLLSGLSFSQTESDRREEVVFGVKAGANYSNVWDESGDDFTADGKAGFVAGAFVSIPIGTYLGIQPEIQFSQKGYQGSGSLFSFPYSYSSTTSFIDVPLLISFKPSPYVTFLAGPQYSFLMNERRNFNSEYYSQEEFETFENDNIRKNIFGVHVGADFNINHFVISPRAGWDLQSNHGDGTSSTPRYKNQWLQLTLGYRF